MALPPETETQILRYHHAERWPIGTIASQLNLHRDSVALVPAQAGLRTLSANRRPSAIDPYLPFILETLTQFPRLRASRLLPGQGARRPWATSAFARGPDRPHSSLAAGRDLRAARPGS